MYKVKTLRDVLIARVSQDQRMSSLRPDCKFPFLELHTNAAHEGVITFQ